MALMTSFKNDGIICRNIFMFSMTEQNISMSEQNIKTFLFLQIFLEIKQFVSGRDY